MGVSGVKEQNVDSRFNVLNPKGAEHTHVPMKVMKGEGTHRKNLISCRMRFSIRTDTLGVICGTFELRGNYHSIGYRFEIKFIIFV